MRDMVPSARSRQVAAHVAAIFDVKPKVFLHRDVNDDPTVFVLEADNRPCDGVTSYSTVGLSDHDLSLESGAVADFSLELLGACRSSVSDFASCLGTAATCVFRDRWPCYPGAIFPEIVAAHGVSETMKHLLFVDPFTWGDVFESKSIEGKVVAWLQAVPISEQEFRYAEQSGTDALLTLLEERGVDVFDIDRASAI